MNIRKRLGGVLMAAPLLLGSVAVTSAATSTPAFVDASCTSNSSIYGTLADGRLTYSVVDPDNGNFVKVVTSTATLGFTPKTIATLNFNTVLVTSTGGDLYRVDILTNNTSLLFSTPVAIGHGWTHDLLTYDGHGHLYGIAGNTLLQYVVSGAKPVAAQVGRRKEIGTGFTLKTLVGLGGQPAEPGLDDERIPGQDAARLFGRLLEHPAGW